MTYPPIDIEQLNQIVALVEDAISDRDVLMPGVCPYDGPTIDILRKLVDAATPKTIIVKEEKKNPVGRPPKSVTLPLNEVEKEIEEIRKEIGQLKLDAKGLETADRIQIIKTRAALVEKIIGMKERIHNLKQQRQFIVEVIAIMEDVMKQSEREEMITRLKPFLEE